MPELPEVEVTRRRIAPHLVGRRIRRLRTTRPSYFFVTSPARLRRALAGRTATGLERHGKYLLASLDDGARLVLHLGMTGQLFSAGAASLACSRPPRAQPRARGAAQLLARRPHASVFRVRGRRARGVLPRHAQVREGVLARWRRGASAPRAARHRRARRRRRAALLRDARAAHRDQEAAARPVGARGRRETSTPTRRCSSPACVRRAAPRA